MSLKLYFQFLYALCTILEFKISIRTDHKIRYIIVNTSVTTELNNLKKIIHIIMYF